MATAPKANPAEEPLLTTRPSAASIVLLPLRSILILVAGFAVLWYFAPPSAQRNAGLAILLGLLLARVVWQAVWRACAKYELTTRRVRATVGVFSRYSVEMPLGRVQNTILSQSFTERLAGIGTIGIASAGTDLVEITWRMVDVPGAILAKVRDAADRFSNGDGVGQSQPLQPKLSRLPVLGVVGGIGAGKSAVAQALARRGAVILDSDTQAKELLEAPDIRDALVSWWGPAILRDGRVDRKKVADIVFADPAQRHRLESIIHPRIKTGRRHALEAAALAGMPLAVIDAPLLLEAGVDKECDAVVYVDAPRSARLERVRGRGWDEAELDRRERAQLPLEEKRARSQFIVTNDGNESHLEEQVEDLFRQVLARFGTSG